MLRWAVGRHGDWIDRGPAWLDGPLVTLHSDGRTSFTASRPWTNHPTLALAGMHLAQLASPEAYTPSRFK